MDTAVFVDAGFALIIVGIVLIFLAVILSARKTHKEGTQEESKTQAAEVIMIGPIPIIFGTDKKAVKGVVILAIALTVLLIIWTILNYLLR